MVLIRDFNTLHLIESVLEAWFVDLHRVKYLLTLASASHLWGGRY